MDYNLPKSKKKVALVIGAIILAAITGFYLYSPKLPTYEISIAPTELLPFVSQEQARVNICDTMKGQLYDEICQEKFNGVGKEDAEKIDELFSLLKKIEEDQVISDYERLLLAQAVFASLPTKDSPLALQPEFSETLSDLKDFISQKNIAYAAEANGNSAANEADFQKMMMEDLEKVLGNLPEGDNAWVISVAISRHEWINGERQPIYSEQYGESYDPYPGVLIEDKSGWDQHDSAHVQSRVGSRSTSSTSQNIGEGERIAYSFSIMSWQSKPYGADSKLVIAEAGPSEKYLTSRYNLSEENYKGMDFLSDLLGVVDMPSREQPNEQPEQQEKVVPPPGTPIKRSDIQFIQGTPGCDGSIDDPRTGLYCFDNYEQLEQMAGAPEESGDPFKHGVVDIIVSTSPTYPYIDAAELEKEYDDCLEQHSSEDADQCMEIYN